MFRHRPPDLPPQPDEDTLDGAEFGDWAHGFCYLARQSALAFGRRRYRKNHWRPVVSLARRGQFFLVFPATTQANPRFFHLRAADCFFKRRPPAPQKDSFLCYRYEALSPESLIETGVVAHTLRLKIMAWLKQPLR